jgi:hypothetical protein
MKKKIKKIVPTYETKIIAFHMTNGIEACNYRRIREVAKGPIMFVTSFFSFAHPSVCMYQSGFHCTDFREI